MSGFVSIVGSGPGSMELLTLAAVRRLEQASLVLFDALLDSEVLTLAPKARRFYVGKRAGKPSLSQEDIIKLMLRGAARGERVVRLKCGDPFVLGRGGEEALALHAAGVPFEVVPGVSSALAAPALAGIPVTHRGVASAFVVVSGHHASSFEPVLSSLRPGSATVVVLMGLSSRTQIGELLLQAGWQSITPAAVVMGASWQHGAVWRGTLGELGAAPVEHDPHAAPGTLVVGDVVALSAAVGSVMPSVLERAREAESCP